MHLAKKSVEPQIVLLPVLTVFLQPSVRFLERLGFKTAGPPLRVSAARNKARLFQYLDVPRYGRLAHVERLRQFHDRCVAPR